MIKINQIAFLCTCFYVCRLVAQQLLYCYIISSWLHLCGCCVKAYFSLYLLTMYFIKDFSSNGTSIQDQVGVSTDYYETLWIYYNIIFMDYFLVYKQDFLYPSWPLLLEQLMNVMDQKIGQFILIATYIPVWHVHIKTIKEVLAWAMNKY